MKTCCCFKINQHMWNIVYWKYKYQLSWH